MQSAKAPVSTADPVLNMQFSECVWYVGDAKQSFKAVWRIGGAIRRQQLRN
jgi:hypothetical protein